MKLQNITISRLQKLLLNRKISPQEITQALLARIREKNSRVNAYLTVAEDEAPAQAGVADKRLGKGDGACPLTGIPLAIKDNICIKGVRMTCASKILEHYVPPYNATVIERLSDQGYVLLGKTNMDEFAMGSSTENSGFAPTRNPWDTRCVPGGSSGGSAAAVAAGMCAAALGSDTGGSIRQPAAFCGVVGLKPTYGLVSRYGLVAFASSLDQIGPITRDVRDAAILLSAIAGHDPRDSTSAPKQPPDYLSKLGQSINGLRLGLPKEYFAEGLDPEVAASLEAAREVFSRLGVQFQEVSLPHTDYSIAAYYLIAPAEASSNLARYDGVRYGHRTSKPKNLLQMYYDSREEGFGAEVKRRIMLGTYALSAGYYDAYYLKAQKVRTLIKRDFDLAFTEVDALLTPTAPSPAFRLGEKVTDPLQMYLSDIYTNSVNLAGLPAISVPCGFTANGLPVGLQLIGPAFGEDRLLTIAYAYERETDWHTRRPNL